MLCISQAAAAVRLRCNLKVAPDGVTSELLSDLRPSQVDELMVLAICEKVSRPLCWSRIPVTVLPKSKGVTLFQNRLIACQAASHKLYLSAFQHAIYHDIEDHLDVLMGGIRKGDLASAWIARINVAIAKCTEWGIRLCLGFVDISRAFASINHAFLLQACQRIGMKPAWLKLITHELQNTSIDLFVNRTFVGNILLERGLVEGIPTSSLLLAIFLSVFWARVRQHPAYCEKVMTFPSQYNQIEFKLHAAGWVDDWILASMSTEGLQTLVTLVSTAFEDLGMHIAMDKFKWRAAGFNHPPNALYWKSRTFMRNSEVVFLGALISNDGVMAHIDYRYRRMLASWGSMRTTLSRKGANRSHLCKAADAVALPAYLWAIEIFPITTNVLMRLVSDYLVVLRMIVGRVSPHDREKWIHVHSVIKQLYRDGKLQSPVVRTYYAQERLYRFLQNRPAFDLHKLMNWRSNQWLSTVSRRSRPSRARPGNPPKQLESEFLHREEFSVFFRAHKYADNLAMPPFA